MPRIITKTPQARKDLVANAAYMGEFNERAAYRFLRAVLGDLKRLLDFPRIGAIRQVRNPKMLGLRSWPVSGFRDYLIFYVPTRRGIRVVRIIHGARDLSKIFPPR
jgi:toxin ParE1/3/4